MYAISELNGVKVYNLSAGKTTNQFIEEASTKKKSLRYNTDYRKRIELIQDFEFPGACGRVKISEDHQYIVASGIYPPQIKIFETSDLSMKCMRGMDSEIVQFSILSPDYSKLAFICADRSVEFHAQYGRHYKTRVPKFPREICFNPHTSDLIVGGSSEDIWRLSLDEGKFLTPLTSDSTEINALDFNSYLNVLMAGGKSGIIETFDYRERSKVNKVIANKGVEITALTHDASGYLFASGSQDGLVRLYDLRYSSHLLEVQHPYKLPIKTVRFHEESKNLISLDKKMIKIYNKNSGKVFTNIESTCDLNDVELVGNSGLLLVANEEVRIGTYFIPELGPAPKWCPLLENITEELEEELTSTVYDEYKFVTREDLEALNASHMIGTKFLKQYLHGFLMKIKMYNKLKSVNDPFAYEKYKQEQIKKKIEDQRNRIIVPVKKPKVNEQLETELKQKKAKGKFDPAAVLEDPRFKQLFTKDEFAIDTESEAYALLHPTFRGQRARKARVEDMDSEGEEPEDISIDHKVQELENKKKVMNASFAAKLKQERESQIPHKKDKLKKKVKF